ncbi:MAG TPA: hypothetical protein VF902_08465 [Coriobacteriia bacterium]
MRNAMSTSVARKAPAILIALALVAIAVIGVQWWGAVRYAASADTTHSLAARLADSEAAYRVMPLWRAYRVRVITLRGLALFERGDILGAYDVLHAEFVAETIARDLDPELVAAHTMVRDENVAASSRTAHLMHGHERWDGTLAPEDIEHFPRPATPTPSP